MDGYSYRLTFGGVMTQWGTYAKVDLGNPQRLSDAADAILAIVDSTPPHMMRPAVDQIEVWSECTGTLPTRTPDYARSL